MTAMPQQTGELRAGIALALLLPFQSSPVRAQISVDVNLIVLHVTVHDSRGHDVLNLGQEDFRLYEDGVAQSIKWFRREDTPVMVGLIVDHSGSMRPKLNDVTAAAERFTDNPTALELAISGVPAIGQTILYDAIAAGLEELEQGSDNANTLAGITRMAEQSSAPIYTIGMLSEDDPDASPGVLKHLAEATGGEAFLPRGFSEVAGIRAHIAADIRSQYMIGYVPANVNEDGAHHTIRLVTEAPGQGKLRVRTRTGYIAEGASK